MQQHRHQSNSLSLKTLRLVKYMLHACQATPGGSVPHVRSTPVGTVELTNDDVLTACTSLTHCYAYMFGYHAAKGQLQI